MTHQMLGKESSGYYVAAQPWGNSYRARRPDTHKDATTQTDDVDWVEYELGRKGNRTLLLANLPLDASINDFNCLPNRELIENIQILDRAPSQRTRSKCAVVTYQDARAAKSVLDGTHGAIVVKGEVALIELAW
eukprot:Trichotokara_eunicae@DN387_c0_g1_i1.p1